jgi:hypothetical protein
LVAISKPLMELTKIVLERSTIISAVARGIRLLFGGSQGS